VGMNFKGKEISKMVKMVEVTKTGGASLLNDEDEKIQINADNVNKIESAHKDYVGTSKIIFNNETSVNVSETKEELNTILNA